MCCETYTFAVIFQRASLKGSAMIFSPKELNQNTTGWRCFKLWNSDIYLWAQNISFQIYAELSKHLTENTQIISTLSLFTRGVICGKR
jgi:hypothetical protein